MSPVAPFAGRKVLLLGRFDEPQGAHSPLKRRALERLGCSVDVVEYAPRGFLDRIRRGDLPERIGHALKEQRPDLVLALGPDVPIASLIAELRELHPAHWATWWPSDTAVIPTSVDVSAVDSFWVTSTDLLAKFPTVRYLPHACDPSVHRPLRSPDEFRANVAFVGEVTPYRQELLAEVLEFGVAVWGPGWRRTRFKDYCRGESTKVEEYVRAYGGATVALNLYREGPEGAAASASSGLNPRTFELAGMGTAQVMHAREDLAAHFTAGEELLTFRDPEELRAIVGELVHDHQRAEALGHAARRRALGEHTYMHRLQALLESVFP